MQLVSNYGLCTSQFSYSKQQLHHICGSQLEANRQTGFWPVAAENTSGEFNKVLHLSQGLSPVSLPKSERNRSLAIVLKIIM